MPTPASSLSPDLAKLATDLVDDVGAKTGMGVPAPGGENTDDPKSMPSEAGGMGDMGVPMAFIEAVMAADTEGMPREQVTRLLSGMMKLDMIKADDDPKRVASQFKAVTGSRAKLMKVVSAISEKPAPAGGGEVLS